MHPVTGLGLVTSISPTKSIPYESGSVNDKLRAIVENETRDIIDTITSGGGSSVGSFTDLSDTPASLSGNANRLVYR